MKPKYVEISKDDITAKVLASAVPAWTRNGWTAVDDGSSESGAEPVSAEPTVNEGEVQ